MKSFGSVSRWNMTSLVLSELKQLPFRKWGTLLGWMFLGGENWSGGSPSGNARSTMTAGRARKLG